MSRGADRIKGYSGQNPFSDSQGRNFSDSKISKEFCPISKFWTLFNDQHEVLLGTRGSGKTFLLKMMRYSMLKKIDDPKAQQLIREKKYLSLYVPMHLEFITGLKTANTDEVRQITLFYFLFNCLLAESLITEINEILVAEKDLLTGAQISNTLSQKINKIWFNCSTNDKDIGSLEDLKVKIKNLYYNFDLVLGNISDIPPLFRRQLCSSLISTKSIVAKELGLSEELRWIICVDEAEFLNPTLQKCINNVFRSDSNGIALKVATLPYHHKTLETLDSSILVSEGNDFSYQIVDMKFDSQDFIILTNKLCEHRLKTRVNENLEVTSVEDFVGTIGNDDLIDYYRKEVGEEKASQGVITSEIVSYFSPKRKKGASSYPNQRKTIYDKFAPIFFVREMYKKAKSGNSKPGWYAGSSTIRKVSQGNPRLFIQIMSCMFEKACSTSLTPKAQHEVILKFSHDFCNATQALETCGPMVFRELDKISKYLHNRIHGEYLVSAGCSFIIKYDETSFEDNKKWIQKAIAYSRLLVSEDNLVNGLTKETRYWLSYPYAAEYWIPMRGDVTSKIPSNDVLPNSYTVKTDSDDEMQMTFQEVLG